MQKYAHDAWFGPSSGGGGAADRGAQVVVGLVGSTSVSASVASELLLSRELDAAIPRGSVGSSRGWCRENLA